MRLQPARVKRCGRPGEPRHLRKSRGFLGPRGQYALGRLPAPPPAHIELIRLILGELTWLSHVQPPNPYFRTGGAEGSCLHTAVRTSLTSLIHTTTSQTHTIPTSVQKSAFFAWPAAHHAAILCSSLWTGAGSPQLRKHPLWDASPFDFSPEQERPGPSLLALVSNDTTNRLRH